MQASNIMIEEIPVSMFNASISVTELLMKTLENCAKDLAIRCITEASQRHGFDANEEIRVLGLENLVLIRKQMAKKSVSKGETKKEKKPLKEKKSSIPIPFVPEAIEIGGCRGLAYNRGLFTQCPKMRMENGSFCKGCQTEADKNTSGQPDCGSVDMRLSCGLYEFKDPKGRSPVSFVKLLGKLNISVENAIEEAGKLNIDIPAEHLNVVEKAKKSSTVRGRPKKAGIIEAENVTDLFAQLTAEDNNEVIEEGEEKPVKSKKSKLSEEEKAAKKAALEEERANKKAEREAKLAKEKQDREDKRKAELELKKAEREAKLAQEKADREAKREQEKLEREQKKAAAKQGAEEKKPKSKKPEANPVPVKEAVKEVVKEPAAPAPAKVSVTRIQIAGKAYLKSSSNILYDPNTKEELGIWDPVNKTIMDLPEEEEEEEDYDE